MGGVTWRSRSEAGLIFCWNRTLSARFCCSRSNTRVRSFRHSSLRSCGRETAWRRRGRGGGGGVRVSSHCVEMIKKRFKNKPSG